MWGFVAAVAAVFAAALAARFLMIEPRNSELVCASGAGPAWCLLRRALVPVFTWQAFGGISMMFGLFGAARRRPAWGMVAMLFGAAGLVLYNVELASFGFILGLIAFVRRPADAGLR